MNWTIWMTSETHMAKASKPAQFRRSVYVLVTSAIFLASGGTVLAQQVLQPADLTSNEADEENIPRRYAVEMIVFEYRDSNAGGTELFLPDRLPVDGPLPLNGDLPNEDSEFSEHAVREYSDATTMTREAANVVPPPQDLSPEDLVLNEIGSAQQMGLQILSPAEYSLDDIYEKLERLDAYQPLLRTAWSQLTVPEEQSRALKLRRLGNPPISLDGTVTLYLGRYLHLVVDLALEESTRSSRSRNAMPAVEPGDDHMQPGTDRTGGEQPSADGYEYLPDTNMQQGTVYYRIQEDRIVRNGELRYFDHPKFGVIAKITRVEENASQPALQP